MNFLNNILVTTTTTGTGTLTQSSAVTGFVAPVVGDDSKTFVIMIKAVDGSGAYTGDWELTESVYTHSGTTWSRGTLLESSTGSRISFAAGTKQIAIVTYASLYAAFVSKVGTPVNNQIGVWTGSGTIEGDANLTFTGGVLTLGTLGNVASADPIINISRNINSGTGAGHAYSDSTNFERDTYAYGSYDARPTIGASGHAYDHYAAYQAFPQVKFGTISAAYGFVSLATIDSGATVSFISHLEVADVTGAGSLVDQYGVYIPQLTKGSTSNWAIYSAGAATPSYHAGTVQIVSGITVGANAATLGTVKLYGSTSGDATIQPPAVAGTATVITLPGATGTLATLAGTETLSNKTLSYVVASTTEITTTPSGASPSATLTLANGNQQTLALTSASGTAAITVTGPVGVSAQGSIIIQQHATTSVDITWAISAGTLKIADEPDWGADAPGSYRCIGYRWNGSVMLLFPSSSMA